jgi:hypothetical protein
MVTSRQQLTKTLMFVDNEIKRTEEEEEEGEKEH